MNRIFTLIGVVIAVLAAVFSLANFLTGSLILLLAAAVILIGVGVLTGQ